MEQFRTQLNFQSSGIFNDESQDLGGAKVTTQIFDSTLPSELQFDDQSDKKKQVCKQQPLQFAILDNIVPNNERKQIEESINQTNLQTQNKTQYQILTKPIVNFTLKKIGNSSILRQNSHPIGSYIPYPYNIKTFSVKFYDEFSQLNKGASTFKLFWQNIVGYSKIQIYINNGFIYLLQMRKQGFLVKSIWDLQYLFKIFSDKEENKLRLIFRTKENDEYKLITKKMQEVDLNVLSCLIAQTKGLQFRCEQ